MGRYAPFVARLTSIAAHRPGDGDLLCLHNWLHEGAIDNNAVGCIESQADARISKASSITRLTCRLIDWMSFPHALLSAPVERPAPDRNLPPALTARSVTSGTHPIDRSIANRRT